MFAEVDMPLQGYVSYGKTDLQAKQFPVYASTGKIRSMNDFTALVPFE
jgi:hypothetical protein